MKLLTTTLLLAVLLSPLLAAAGTTETRVAVLVSGYGNQSGGKISYDLEELAQAYLVLIDNGVRLDIVSPAGGAVPVHNKKDDLKYIQRFKQQTPALQQLANTLSARQALENEYQGLMIIGGDGAMFDLPFDSDTQKFISRFAEHDLPLAAVCHGPAALVNIKQSNGEYFITGKRINSFTDAEEQAFSADLLAEFPFNLQSTIENRGAEFVYNGPMLPFVAQDGKLITAQNPMSVAKATDALLLMLGKTPDSRELFKDEATMQLVSQARAEGAFLIDVALARSPDSYDLDYLALYGFYAYSLATSEADKRTELHIMRRIGQHFRHPKYASALIGALVEQGQEQEARAELERLISEFPEYEVPAAFNQLKQPRSS
jgi:putative intracellular protease/amidase